MLTGNATSGLTRDEMTIASAPEEIRTPNLLIRSQMLYPLSYGRLSSVVFLGRIQRRREDLNLRSP